MFKKIAGFAAAALLMAAGSASAATFTCTPAAGACTFDGSMGNLVNAVAAKSSTTDTFSMTFASAGKLLLSFTSSPIKLTNTSFDGQAFKVNMGQSYSFDIAKAGTYNLVMTATNPSNKASKYTGTIDFAAVPEPATWGMMIAGVGMAGGALRRRKSSKLATA